MRVPQVNKLYPIEYNLPLDPKERTAIRAQIPRLITYLDKKDYKENKYTEAIRSILLQYSKKYKLTDKQLIFLNHHYIYTWKYLYPEASTESVSKFLNKKNNTVFDPYA